MSGGGVDPAVADAVARLVPVFQAAIVAQPDQVVFVARDALAGVTDVAELRLVAAVAVAVTSALLVPAAGVPGEQLRWAVDFIGLEAAWRAS